MKTISIALLLAVAAFAETPLAKPLSEFDKLAAELKASNVVGSPITVGETTIVPFGRMEFGMGTAGVMVGVGGGMGAKLVPLGVLVIEGDDVRAELIEERGERPSILHELIKGIIDRKIVFMGNGINLGNAPGNVGDLAPLIASMMGQTTWMGQALNLGTLKAPTQGTVEDVKRLHAAKKDTDALALIDSLLAKEPKNAALHVWKGKILMSMADANPADKQKHRAAATQAFKKALELEPGNAEANKAVTVNK